MAKSPPVSVVIPAFNAESVIGETLGSVRAQTFRDFEVIVVDDGSRDGTADIVRRFCEKDPRFCLLEQGNRGTSAARNAGLERARGEFIAFLDHDDVWFPEKLARQVELSHADPRANFLFANFYFWDGKQDLHPMYESNQPLPEGDTLRQLIFGCCYCPLTVMVRRETLVSAGQFDTSERFSEDWDMWLRIGERGIWARGIREPLARYRRWPGSLTMNRLWSVDGNIRVLQKHLEITRRDDLRPLYRRSLAWARASREIACVRSQAEKDPGVLPAAVWRAWRCQPSWKWLRWYWLLVWPAWLGGRLTRRGVHRKIFTRWQT